MCSQFRIPHSAFHIQNGSPAWTRTKTRRLTAAHATFTSREIETGAPCRIFTCIAGFRRAALYNLSYRSIEEWSPTPVLRRVSPGPKPGGLLSSSWEFGGARPVCTVNLLRVGQVLHWIELWLHEMATRTGAAPAISALTGRRVCCFSSES